MLRIYDKTGSIELTPQDEARLRAMSDHELCARLNRDPGDALLQAESRARGSIDFYPGYGYLPKQ